MGKLLVILIFFGVVIGAIYYISQMGKQPTPCPDGQTYARVVTGGWAPTDPTDSWGQCISNSQIGAANSQ